MMLFVGSLSFASVNRVEVLYYNNFCANTVGVLRYISPFLGIM